MKDKLAHDAYEYNIEDIYFTQPSTRLILCKELITCSSMEPKMKFKAGQHKIKWEIETN